MNVCVSFRLCTLLHLVEQLSVESVRSILGSSSLVFSPPLDLGKILINPEDTELTVTYVCVCVCYIFLNDVTSWRDDVTAVGVVLLFGPLDHLLPRHRSRQLSAACTDHMISVYTV